MGRVMGCGGKDKGWYRMMMLGGNGGDLVVTEKGLEKVDIGDRYKFEIEDDKVEIFGRDIVE